MANALGKEAGTPPPPSSQKLSSKMYGFDITLETDFENLLSLFTSIVQQQQKATSEEGRGGRYRKNTKTTHRNAQLTDGKGGEKGLSSLSHVWRDAVLRESVSVSCVSLASSACVCGRIVLRKISNTLLAGPGALTKKYTLTPFYTLFSALRLDFGLRCDCVLSVRFRACGQGEQKH